MNVMRLSQYIIFENADVIAINKPEGLLSLPDGYNPQIQNLKAILISAYDQIWVVHRLDKDTSGVIVYAKNLETHKRLNAAFASREVTKSYSGVIFGYPFWDEKYIEYPLKTNVDRRHRTVVDTFNGTETFTRVAILHKCKNHSIAEIQPHSGLTHQIRAHLAAIGHPILGDSLYSFLREKNRTADNFALPVGMDCTFMHVDWFSTVKT